MSVNKAVVVDVEVVGEGVAAVVFSISKARLLEGSFEVSNNNWFSGGAEAVVEISSDL